MVVQEASSAGRHTGASGLACSGPPTLQGAGETAVWAGHVAACSAAATQSPGEDEAWTWSKETSAGTWPTCIWRLVLSRLRSSAYSIS